MRKILALLASLPTIEIGMDDWHLHVGVGERKVGFTVGPRFLSLDWDNDIQRQVISPPVGYEGPMSDITFSWSSRQGLIDLNIPGVKVGDYQPPTGVRKVGLDVGPGEEEEEPVTQRWAKVG